MLRAQIIRVLYGTGAFDWNATITTANTVAFFSLGLLAQSLIPLLARAFYALSETRTPFLVSIFSEACTLAAALLFTQPRFGIASHLPGLMNVAGLACAASIGATINALILYILLRRKMLGLQDQELFILLIKTGIAGAGMAIGIQLCKYPVALLVDMDRWWGILLHGFISGIVGLLIYAGLSAVLRVPELFAILEGLKRRFLKKKMVSGAIDDGSTP
jgi:putative peptidoglycan lipid II flippase